MNLADALKRDWRYFDEVEDASFQPMNPPRPAIDGVKVLRGDVTRATLALFGPIGLEPDDMVLQVWNAREVGSTDVDETVGRGVTNGDRFTLDEDDDATSLWIVKNYRWSRPTQRWHCVVRKAK